MANIFKNASGTVNSSPGTILYATPSGNTAVVHSLFISNTSSVPQTVTIELVDASASASYKLVTNAPLPVGGSLSIPKPINLEGSDSLRIVASTGSAVQAVASILEIS